MNERKKQIFYCMGKKYTGYIISENEVRIKIQDTHVHKVFDLPQSKTVIEEDLTHEE